MARPGVWMRIVAERVRNTRVQPVFVRPITIGPSDVLVLWMEETQREFAGKESTEQR